MLTCCVLGCKHQYPSDTNVKFYKIPSASVPSNAKRRRLWLQAIQEWNGSTEQLRASARVCGAHFISGKIRLSVIYNTSWLTYLQRWLRLVAALLSKSLFLCVCLQVQSPWTTTVLTSYPLCLHLSRVRRPGKKRNGKK